MIIKNVTDSELRIDDIKSTIFAAAPLILKPDVEITIYNEDAERSPQLRTHVDAARVEVIDTGTEPSTGGPLQETLPAGSVGNTTAQWNASQLQGVDISATTPLDGEVLVYDSGEWAPGVNDHGTLVGLGDDDHPQYQLRTEKGVAGGYASLDGSAKVPLAQLPGITITNTFVVASQAAMLALVAETGDIAIRTDLSKSFVLAAEPATILANWAELLAPPAPVTSVNGEIGVVVLDTDDVSEATNKYVTASQKDALAGTDGSPSVTNKFVTDSDTRNTNSRTPTAHAASHASAGSDPVTLAQSQVTDLTSDLADRALDADVVHLTGNESIAGTKTFSDDIVADGGISATGTDVDFNSKNLTSVNVLTASSTTTSAECTFDSGTTYAATFNKSVRIQSPGGNDDLIFPESVGAIGYSILNFNSPAFSTTRFRLESSLIKSNVVHLMDGGISATGSSISFNSKNLTDIGTINGVDITTLAVDSTVVHLAGVETITGRKSFQEPNGFTSQTLLKVNSPANTKQLSFDVNNVTPANPQIYSSTSTIDFNNNSLSNINSMSATSVSFSGGSGTFSGGFTLTDGQNFRLNGGYGGGATNIFTGGNITFYENAGGVGAQQIFRIGSNKLVINTSEVTTIVPFRAQSTIDAYGGSITNTAGSDISFNTKNLIDTKNIANNTSTPSTWTLSDQDSSLNLTSTGSQGDSPTLYFNRVLSSKSASMRLLGGSFALVSELNDASWKYIYKISGIESVRIAAAAIDFKIAGGTKLSIDQSSGTIIASYPISADNGITASSSSISFNSKDLTTVRKISINGGASGDPHIVSSNYLSYSALEHGFQYLGLPRLTISDVRVSIANVPLEMGGSVQLRVNTTAGISTTSGTDIPFNSKNLTSVGTINGVQVDTHNHSTSVGQTRLAVFDRRRVLTGNIFSIGASLTRYLFGRTTNGYSPVENLHLTKLSMHGNSTLVTGSITVTVWKNGETAGTDKVFEATFSPVGTGFFKQTTTTIQVAGTDAITSSDTLFVSIATAALTAIDDLSVEVEYTTD